MGAAVNEQELNNMNDETEGKKDHNLIYINFGVHKKQQWGQPGPSRVSDGPVSAENVIYEAFVLMGELGGSFSSLL